MLTVLVFLYYHIIRSEFARYTHRYNIRTTSNHTKSHIYTIAIQPKIQNTKTTIQMVCYAKRISCVALFLRKLSGYEIPLKTQKNNKIKQFFFRFLHDWLPNHWKQFFVIFYDILHNFLTYLYILEESQEFYEAKQKQITK